MPKIYIPRNTQENLNKKLNILTIKDMVQLTNLKFGYELANNMLPSRIVSMYQEDSKCGSLLPNHQYNTRNRKNSKSTKTANKLYRDSFLFKGPRSILTLDQCTQKSPNLNIFTAKCKKILNS